MLYVFMNGNCNGFKDVKWKYILHQLRPFVSAEDELRILAIKDKGEQDLEVIKLLQPHAEATEFLVKALYNGYKWLSNDLRTFVARYQTTEDKLRRRSVPYKTAYEMYRPEMVQRVREALIKACRQHNRRHWVVLHGMMGSGKSVLAAQALRDPVIALDTFKKDICWLALGQEDVADDHYLLKVQCLCEQLRPNFCPGNWDSCKTFLRSYFADNLDSILVLDDVNSSDLISKFDFGIPILVTTQNLNNMPDFTIGRRTTINLDSGFTEEQSKTLFSNYLKISLTSLPPEVVYIHDKYKGLPLVIAVVCGHLLHFPKATPNHWQDVWSKLQTRQLGRIRHTSGKTDLKAAVKWTVDSLPDDLREKFKDFSLFWEDLFVPQEVFELLWDLSEIDTEEVMCSLEKYSLILKREEDILPHGSFSNSLRKCYCYGVHDLILAYLKESDSENEIVHHRELVEKYLDKCRDRNGQCDYGRLPKDGYIHVFIGYHLAKSGQHQLFPELYFDLGFLQAKIEVSGLFDVLSDFNHYAKYFRQKRHMIEDFKKFLCQNGYQLFSSNDVDDSDVHFDLIQLGLKEPKKSPVYQQAIKALNRQKPNKNSLKLYYNWCNQSSIQESLILSICPHFPKATNWAVFSPDGLLIASAGEDNLLKVWDIKAEKELEVYLEHEWPVVCCCFSSSSQLLLSASTNELKLWDLQNDQVFFGNSFQPNSGGDSPTEPVKTPLPRRGSCPFETFTPTSPGSTKTRPLYPISALESDSAWCITTCAMSKSKKKENLLAAAGYENGIVKIWKLNAENIVTSLEGHSAEITCVTFSAKDILGSSSKDKTVILWDPETGQMLRQILHSDYVVLSCEFNKSGDTILSSAGNYAWLWDLGAESHTIPVQYDGLKTSSLLNHCSFSPDSNYIAGGLTNGSVILWSRNGKLVCRLPGHSDAVCCVHFSQDGTKLLSASFDGRVNLWSIKDHENSPPSNNIGLTKDFDIKFLTNSTENSPIIALQELNHVQLITTLDGRQKWRSSFTGEISSCCLSPDARILIYTTCTGVIKVQHFTSDYQPSASRKFHTDLKITKSCFSTCGKWFVTCLKGGPILRWASTVSENTHPVHLLGHTKDILGCRMYTTQNLNSMMLTWAADGKLKIWDLTQARCVVSVSHGTENVTCGDVHPGQNVLVSGSVDKTVRLWKQDTGKLEDVFTFSACVRSCCLDTQGDLVAAGDDEGCIKIFSVKEKTCSYEFRRSRKFVHDLHFSQDSTMLLSAGDGLCWWSLHPGRRSNLRQTFTFLGGEFQSVSVSSDFSTCVMIDSNGILFILKQICSDFNMNNFLQ